MMLEKKGIAHVMDKPEQGRNLYNIGQEPIAVLKDRIDNYMRQRRLGTWMK